jgi:hypothetical protein
VLYAAVDCFLDLPVGDGAAETDEHTLTRFRVAAE